MSRQTVAIAGAGDFAKYLVEELLSDGSYDIAVLTTGDRPWFNRPGVTVHIVTYTQPSILAVLNSTRATVLFSMLNQEDPAAFVAAHTALLDACRASTHTKRLVPSEYSGDIDKFPDIPRWYIPTRGAFRQVLAAQDEVEYTIVGTGWLADYIVPREKRYIKDLPEGVSPVDLEKWEYFRIGSGEEKVTFTATRDVAKALVRLIGVEKGKWPEKVYLEGETTCWNAVIETLGRYYSKPLTHVENERSSRARDWLTIRKIIDEHANDEDLTIWIQAVMDEASISEGSQCPADVVARQRGELFEGIKFRGIEELLKDAARLDKI